MALLNIKFPSIDTKKLSQRFDALLSPVQDLTSKFVEFSRKPYEAVYQRQPNFQPLKQYGQQVIERAKMPYSQLLAQQQAEFRQRPDYQSPVMQSLREAQLLRPAPVLPKLKVYQEKIKPWLEEKVQIPYNVPKFSWKQPPETRKFALGKTITSFIEEPEEIKTIRQKLRLGEALTPEEKKKALESNIYFAMDILQTAPLKEVNLRKYGLTDEGEKILRQQIETIKPELESLKGKPLSHAEVLEEAKKGDILTKASTREMQKKAIAAEVRLRQGVANLTNRLATEGRIDQTELKDLLEGYKIANSWSTSAGRTLQTQKIVAEDQPFMEKILREVMKTADDTDKVLKAAEGVDFTNQKQVNAFYRQFVEPTTKEVLREYRYANMLSNPRSQLRNALGNIVQTYFVRPSVILGTEGPKAAAQYYKGSFGAIPDAIGDFQATMKGELPIEKPDLARIPTGKLPEWYTTGPRAMESGDRFFSRIIQEGELAKGSTAEEAKKVAQSYLYRDQLHPEGQGWLLNKFDDLMQGVDNLRRFEPISWAVPFFKTQLNIAKASIEISPVGLATIPGAANKKAQFAKATLGTIATALGVWLAQNDRTTWVAPRNEEERKIWYAAGYKPYSIRIGDQWIPMAYFVPFGLALAIPAAVKYYQTESKEALSDSQSKKVERIALDLVKFVGDQTTLSGLSQFLKIAQGDVDWTFGRWAGFTLSQAVPLSSFLNYVADFLDPVYRKPKTAFETIKAGLPFLSKQVEPYLTPEGEPAKMPWSHLVTPYTIGTAQPSYEAQYKNVQGYRQLTTALNKIISGDKSAVDQILKSPGQFQIPETATDLERLYLQKELFGKAREIFRSTSPTLTLEQKKAAIEKLGFDPDEVAYSAVQNLTVKEKTDYIRIALGKLDEKGKFKLLQHFRIHKSIDDDQPILTDAVIKNLYKVGLISKRDRDQLLKLGKEPEEPKLKGVFTPSLGQLSTTKFKIKAPEVGYRLPTKKQTLEMLTEYRPQEFPTFTLEGFPRFEATSRLQPLRAQIFGGGK